MSRWPAVLVYGLSLGCAAGDAAVSWEGTIDTTVSGVVVVHNPQQGVWDGAAVWHLEPTLMLGSRDVEGPQMFGTIADVVTDSYGRLYVLDRTAKEIRVFDRDGAHVRTFGRAGAGPGELENPNGMKLAPDAKLWVSDPRNARYAVFDTSGKVIAHHRRPISSYGWLWDGGFTSDGSMWERGVEWLGEGETRSVLIRMTVDQGVTLADTLELPDIEQEGFEFDFTTQDGRQGTTHMLVPFTSRMLRQFDPRGYVWAVESGQYRIAQIDIATGDTVRIVEKPYAPIDVRQEDIDEAFASVRERIPNLKYDASRIPSSKPAIRNLHVDAAGYLWVEPHTTFEKDSSAFDVFDDRGIYLGRVTAPLRLAEYATLEIGPSSMVGITRDELDVPYVVRLRIVGREAPATASR